jgi:ribonuclease HII
VTRDRRLAELEESHGPLGSGYPSDPATRAAVRRIVDAHLASGAPLPNFVRARWSTVARLLAPSIVAKVQGELSF